MEGPRLIQELLESKELPTQTENLAINDVTNRLVRIGLKPQDLVGFDHDELIRIRDMREASNE